MNKRTTEQWEALLDGTADGPWEVKHHGDDLVVSICTTVHDPKRFVGDFYGEWNARLAAAAPEAVAEVVRIHKAIKDRIHTLSAPLCSHMPEGDQMDEYVEQWERQQYEISVLANILNGETHE